MVGLDRAYDFHKVVSTTNAFICMSWIEYSENGLKFNIVDNKMENIWEKPHLVANGEVEHT